MKSLNEIPPRDGHRLKKYCQHHPNCEDIRECGDHVIARGPKGSAVFPDREMGKGLWCKVVKEIIAVGLGALAILGYISWMS